LSTKFAWAKKVEFNFLMGYVDLMGLLDINMMDFFG
jgi:hypothetical protein